MSDNPYLSDIASNDILEHQTICGTRLVLHLCPAERDGVSWICLLVRILSQAHTPAQSLPVEDDPAREDLIEQVKIADVACQKDEALSNSLTMQKRIVEQRIAL